MPPLSSFSNLLNKNVEKYLSAIPKQYYFDSEQGIFREGSKPIISGNNKPILMFSINPLAYCFFAQKLFEKDNKDLWVELYFTDHKDAISTIMFKNSSALSLLKLCEDLYYKDLSLTDVELRISRTDKINRNGKKWYLATYRYNDDFTYPF